MSPQETSKVSNKHTSPTVASSSLGLSSILFVLTSRSNYLNVQMSVIFISNYTSYYIPNTCPLHPSILMALDQAIVIFHPDDFNNLYQLPSSCNIMRSSHSCKNELLYPDVISKHHSLLKAPGSGRKPLQ